MARLFGHGDLRLYLLKLLETKPRHGYELIRLLEDRFYGLYTPSAGTIYPRLSAMEDDGLVTHELIDGRKVYRITDAGRAELAARSTEMDGLEERVSESARDLAGAIKAEVKASIRDLRDELKTASGQVRREDRRARRHHYDDRHDDLGRELRRAVRGLQDDVRTLSTDLVAAVRSRGLDKQAVDALRTILDDARGAVLDVLEGRRSSGADSTGTDSPVADSPVADSPVADDRTEMLDDAGGSTEVLDDDDGSGEVTAPLS